MASMTSTTMQQQRRHSAILWEECFTVLHNNGYEEYVNVMSAMEIYMGMKLMS